VHNDITDVGDHLLICVFVSDFHALMTVLQMFNGWLFAQRCHCVVYRFRGY